MGAYYRKKTQARRRLHPGMFDSVIHEELKGVWFT